jgi:hypothetical protein
MLFDASVVTEAPNKRRLVAISPLTRILKAYRRKLIDPKIAEHCGRIVKTTGDGLRGRFRACIAGKWRATAKAVLRPGAHAGND